MRVVYRRRRDWLCGSRRRCWREDGERHFHQHWPGWARQVSAPQDEGQRRGSLAAEPIVLELPMPRGSRRHLRECRFESSMSILVLP